MSRRPTTEQAKRSLALISPPAGGRPGRARRAEGDRPLLLDVRVDVLLDEDQRRGKGFRKGQSPRTGEGDRPQDGGGGPVQRADPMPLKEADLSAEASAKAEATAKAEAGMAEMSEKYRDGGDLYVPAE